MRIPLLLFVTALPLQAQQAIVQGPLAQRLDSAVLAAAAQGFHGNVLVTDRGKVVLLKGYGLANETAGTPFTPATLVQIGSNVKDFTKVAIYQLVEAGRLRLTDSLVRFVPGLAADKHGITVRHLMQHTAGLPQGVAMDAQPLSRDEMLRRLNALQLASAPGERERYSNLGYALLALIVERLSGQSFDGYVAERVLRPAGLRETGSFLPGFDRARVAHGYSGTRDIGIILDMPHDADGHLYSLRGNGGYLSTLSDMLRFYDAVGGSALLREPEHRRAVFDPDGADILAGGDLTSQFMFANLPGREARVFIASNHSGYQANRLLRVIESVLGPPAGGGAQMVERDGGPRDTGPLQDRLPDTGPGRTVAAYLEAYNAGDTAVMRRFFTERGATGPEAPPIPVRLERYLAMRSNLGRLTLRGVRPAPDGGLAVVAASERGETLTLTFIVDENPPNRLRGIQVEVGN